VISGLLWNVARRRGVSHLHRKPRALPEGPWKCS
jgi:hypothetical protein